jgi:hypothetical protein
MNLDPSEDQAIRNIEPSCSLSLPIWTAMYRLPLKRTFSRFSTAGASTSSVHNKEELRVQGTNFQIRICETDTIEQNHDYIYMQKRKILTQPFVMIDV